MSARIDSHQHFWEFDIERHSWMDDSMSQIRKHFLPSDLAPILASNQIDGCIAVQADQSEGETTFLLDAAHNNDFIKGVVGWVDLSADNVAERLSYFSQDPFFKGVRHIVQSEPVGFMLGENFQRGISKLKAHDLVYDILVFPNQLEDAIALATQFPEQVFVLDHIAKPPIKDGGISEWAEKIKRLGACQNVHCKVSGLVTEADWSNWQEPQFTPYLDVVLESFGIDRLMFGSDWPVCLLAAEYERVLEITTNYFSRFSTEETDQLFGGNASRIYQLS